MRADELIKGWPEVIPTGADKFFTVMVDDFQANFLNRLPDLQSRGIRPAICVAMQYLTTDDGTAYVVPSYNRGVLRKPQDNPNKTYKWSDLERAQDNGFDLAYHGYAHPFDSISQSAMPSDFENFMAAIVAHNESAAKKIKITGYIGPNGVNMPIQMIQRFCWARPGPAQGYGRSYGVSTFRNIGCCFENGLWLDKTTDPIDTESPKRPYYTTSLEKITTDIVPNGKVSGGKFLNLSFHAYTAENQQSWQDILDLFDYLLQEGFVCVSPMRAVTYSFCASGNLGANSPVAVAGDITYHSTNYSEAALVGGYNVTGAAGNNKRNESAISSEDPLWNWWDTGTPTTTYTATFVADGVTVDTVEFEAGASVLPRVPAVPAKTGYTGAWEPYTLADADITINAVYTAVEPEPPEEPDEPDAGATLWGIGADWQPVRYEGIKVLYGIDGAEARNKVYDISGGEVPL